jgi:nucleotide-binding universal stress UspA family protein
MFHRILLAYDGSEHSTKAFALALDLADKYAAKLHVLSVARPPDFAEDVETEALLENAQERFETLFVPLRKRAAELGITADFEVTVGHPAEQIVRAAERDRADLIVTGHRGHGLFERWLLGSVSRLVIAYGHCPVMVVR